MAKAMTQVTHMMNQATHYDRDCLQRLLDDALAEPLAGDVAEHVAECADCRRHLESLAGGEQFWSRACRGVKAILAEPTAYLSSGDSSGTDESFATDFAVDCLEPSDDPTKLGRLGDYEIVEVIGRGGMGVVLKGFQKELNRFVAVKVLAPHLATSGAARRRFAREAQATAAIVNPHVMAIHAVNANTKLPYLVMPFVACESLQQRLDRQGPLDVKDVLRIGLQAASGLAAAHAQGLVHRDVKPANILLETSVERVMLTDFGLARAVDDATLTRSGIIAGTPQYMSPEQANGDAIDHRSDLFSLGSVLYAMCTGRPPFRAETTFGVLRRIRETAPRPIREINADIPDWLERIVLKLLSKDPASRFATATDVATLLEQCLAHVQQPTTVELPEACRPSSPVSQCSPVAPRQESRTAIVSVCKCVAQWPVRVLSALGFPVAERQGYLLRAAALTALIAVALGVYFTFTRPKPTSTTTDPTTASSEPSTLDPLLQWDATQSELDATASAIEDLEANSRKDIE